MIYSIAIRAGWIVWRLALRQASGRVCPALELDETKHRQQVMVEDYENAMNPYNDRKHAIQKWRRAAKLEVNHSDELFGLAQGFMSIGLKNNDALPLACAVTANCDYFLTTDKGILNKQVDRIVIINPIDFIRKLEA